MMLRVASFFFLAYIASIPIVRPSVFPVMGFRTSLADWLFLVAAASLLVSAFSDRELRRLTSFHVVLVIYLLGFAISLAGMSNPLQGVGKLCGVAYLAAVAATAFAIQRRNPDFVRQAGGAWLVGIGVTALTCLAGMVLFYLGYRNGADNYFLSHFGSLPKGNYPRVHGLFANANMLANYVNVAVAFAFAERRRWLGRTMTAAAIGTTVLALSAGLGGLFLSAGLWFYGLYRRTSPRSAFLALAVSLAASAVVLASTLFSPDTPNTDQQIVVPVSGITLEPSVRVLVWEAAIKTIAEHPVFGIGVGGDVVRVDYVTISGSPQRLLEAHQMWLNVAGQAGIFGLAGLGFLAGYMIRRCGFASDSTDVMRRYVAALSCAFVGGFIYQGLIGSFEDARHLWILFGLLAAAASQIADETTSSMPSDRPAT